MDETLKWIIGISITIVIFIVGFAGRIIYQGRKERERKIEQKLKTHLDDLKREVIDHIVQMTRNITILKSRLSYSDISNILPTYPFEQSDYYNCFKAHFPEEAKQWEKLNKEALKFTQQYEPLRNDIGTRLDELQKRKVEMNDEEWIIEYQKNQKKSQDMRLAMENETKGLTDRCITFSISLYNNIDSINKYGIGKEFKKVNSCPICKKF